MKLKLCGAFDKELLLYMCKWLMKKTHRIEQQHNIKTQLIVTTKGREGDNNKSNINAKRGQLTVSLEIK